MHRLLVLGMNHATAPLSLRERAAFSAEQAQAALTDIQQRYAAEAVIVSTCNRVELYLARPVHAQPRIEQLHQLLADLKGIPVVEVQAHTYNHTDHAAAQHLFRVTCSLDSMVVGEDQILAQVRQAYELAHKSGVTGPILNGLFQRALACGKAVRTQTALAEGRLSIASVAVDHARQIFEDFSDKTLLCLGAGKMALLLLKHLRELKPGRLIIANRDAAKAAVVAEQFGGSPVGLDRLPEALVSADIVLTSTHSAEPVITHAMFEPLCRARRFRPIFFIDIALPRDVEPAVGELDNVYLYNIDDLQTVVAQTQKDRGQAVSAAQAIVDRQVAEFTAWQRARDLGPVIDELYGKFHAVALEEARRIAGRLPDADAARPHLEELARRIVNKLLHEPVRAIRENPASASPHSAEGHYLHALMKLLRADAAVSTAGEAIASDPATNEAKDSDIAPARAAPGTPKSPG